jgi:hypothetical protein
MQSHRRINKLFLPAAFVITVTAAAPAVLPNRGHVGSAFTAQQTTSKGGGEKNDEKDKMPIALSSASLPGDPAERALRLARSNRYNKRHTVPFDEDADTGGRSSINEWYLYIPALPTSASDAVVLAKVVDAKGYLSNDRTGAYSEFTIIVEQIFKDGRRSLMTGNSVVTEREGANVKLPDGRIIRYQIAYQGMPQIGRRYVFFLKYNEQGEDYQVLTGYELRKGRVSPLDEADHFAAYEKLGEDAFLNAVREAVVHPLRAPRGNGGLSQ